MFEVMKYYLIFAVYSRIAGVTTHSLDWRKSAGGFIHGYRYTSKYKTSSSVQ